MVTNNRYLDAIPDLAAIMQHSTQTIIWAGMKYKEILVPILYVYVDMVRNANYQYTPFCLDFCNKLSYV